MPKKRYKAKEIVAKLRQVDVHLSQDSSVTDGHPTKQRQRRHIPPPT